MTKINTGWAAYPSQPQNTPLANQPASRDSAGRFLTGNSGGGRKKGSRNKLTEIVLSAVVTDFEEHGAKAIQSLRDHDCASYLRLVSSLVPRELVLEREKEPNYLGMTLDEIEELVSEARHNRAVQGRLQSLV